MLGNILMILDSLMSRILIFLSSPHEANRFPSIGHTSIQEVAKIIWGKIIRNKFINDQYSGNVFQGMGFLQK